MLFSPLTLHAIFEDLKFVSGQNVLHESCRILNVDEYVHKIYLIWTYKTWVMAILVKLVFSDEIMLDELNEVDARPKWENVLNESC